MGMNRNSVAQLLSRARLRLRTELRGAAGEAIAAAGEECAQALPLLAMADDNELRDDRQALWLQAHLNGCSRCELAQEVMAEAGESYRSWLPLVAIPWLLDAAEAKAAERAHDLALRRRRRGVRSVAAAAAVVLVTAGIAATTGDSSTPPAAPPARAAAAVVEVPTQAPERPAPTRTPEPTATPPRTAEPTRTPEPMPTSTPSPTRTPPGGDADARGEAHAEPHAPARGEAHAQARPDTRCGQAARADADPRAAAPAGADIDARPHPDGRAHARGDPRSDPRDDRPALPPPTPLPRTPRCGRGRIPDPAGLNATPAVTSVLSPARARPARVRGSLVESAFAVEQDVVSGVADQGVVVGPPSSRSSAPAPVRTCTRSKRLRATDTRCEPLRTSSAALPPVTSRRAPGR